MNHLTTAQRKLVYALGILLLLAPIVVLGRPAGRDANGAQTAGGKLATLRNDYDLGETSLGNVDPSSSTMNLVLLGFRGVAVNVLWKHALDERDQKQWAQLRSTTDSIIMLQPHYIKVWDFQGWNLAYNVSAEWDNVSDRYYWVKEGGKFYMRGTDRNAHNPDLAFRTGDILGKKVGRSDEWDYFRKYFNDDPDEKRFNNGPDPEFNRGYDHGKYPDNYLAARDWYLEANEREEKWPPQHIMMRELFRSYPAHAFMDMADALHREGKFDATTQQTWKDGYAAWTREYGAEEFPTAAGPVHLEVTRPEEFEDLARRNSELLKRTVTPAEIKDALGFLQNTSNYRYWRMRSLAESRPETTAAHREIYEGEQLFKEGKLPQSRDTILSGLKKLETVFEDYPGFEQDDLAVEEAVMAMIYLRAIYGLLNEEMPTDLPLQHLWDANVDGPGMEELERQFKRQTTFRSNG